MSDAVRMISKVAKERAKQIGDDSFQLLNFTGLPDCASEKRQLQALNSDRNWQTDHHNEIVSRIDTLMSDIRRSLV